MNVQLGYGKTQISAELPDDACLGVLAPNDSQIAEINNALEYPVGSPRLGQIVRPGERVVIVTSDITRPVPTALLLPPLLNELNGAGVPDSDICVVFALGSHRGHTGAERRALAGAEAFNRIRCLDSDPQHCIPLGVTTRGTPVELFESVVQADRRICLGNIEYHYFAGYSGGAKALLPGVASRSTIQANHSMMLESGARAGLLGGNPVRADIDEVLRFASVDFIVNVVLDDHKRILRAFAGDPIAAHRAGCRYLDGIYKLPVTGLADIVLASPGGHPKDINLYQAQKALDNAALAVRDGGVVILAASCAEGLGEETFERWLLTMRPGEMLREIRMKFVLGGHKAAAIASVLRRASIYLVSDLDPALLARLPVTPFPTVEAALAQAQRMLGRDACTMVMPYAGSTLPDASTNKVNLPNDKTHAGGNHGLQTRIAAAPR